MNAIQKALQEVHFEIPDEILELVFGDPELKRMGHGISIDTRIRNDVIQRRVMVDCNLAGGVQTTIPLTECDRQTLSYNQAVFRVPKEKTQGRTITEVLSVGYASTHYGIQQSQANNPGGLLGAANTVLKSMSDIPVVSTADVQLIGENTILVKDVASIPSNLLLRCTLENDEAMSHLQAASYKHFSQLVIYAVKAHVYRRAAIRMDMGQLHAGMQLGRIREIIDGYSDANELYKTFYEETWLKVAFFNDHERVHRHTMSLVGGGN